MRCVAFVRRRALESIRLCVARPCTGSTFTCEEEKKRMMGRGGKKVSSDVRRTGHQTEFELPEPTGGAPLPPQKELNWSQPPPGSHFQILKPASTSPSRPGGSTSARIKTSHFVRGNYTGSPPRWVNKHGRRLTPRRQIKERLWRAAPRMFPPRSCVDV